MSQYVYVTYKESYGLTIFQKVFSTLRGARAFVKNLNLVAQNNNWTEFYNFERVEILKDWGVN